MKSWKKILVILITWPIISLIIVSIGILLWLINYLLFIPEAYIIKPIYFDMEDSTAYNYIGKISLDIKNRYILPWTPDRISLDLKIEVSKEMEESISMMGINVILTGVPLKSIKFKKNNDSKMDHQWKMKYRRYLKQNEYILKRYVRSWRFTRKNKLIKSIKKCILFLAYIIGFINFNEQIYINIFNTELIHLDGYLLKDIILSIQNRGQDEILYIGNVYVILKKKLGLIRSFIYYWPMSSLVVWVILFYIGITTIIILNLWNSHLRDRELRHLQEKWIMTVGKDRDLESKRRKHISS